MTVAITGATGFVGQALLEVATHRGHRLRALARTIPPERKRANWIGGSLSDTRALAQLMEGVEAVIHVAGLTTSHDPADMEAANVEGTLNVIEAAVAAGVPRLVFVSSLSAREPELSAYGASKARAEKLVMASGLDWTIIRPPTVYGPRDSDLLQLFKSARLGIVPVPPQGRQSVIHVHDLAEFLVKVLPGGEGVTHQVFEPDDGRENGWTHREFAKLIGWSLRRRPFVPHLSKSIMTFGAKMDRLVRRDKARLTMDRVGYMTHPDWVVSADRRVPNTLWKPRIKTRDGIRATAKWYKRHGWL